MATPDLIVETGSGVPGANSWITLDEADAYHEAYGNAAWAPLTDEEKKAALRRATNYIVGAYSGKWKGVRTYEEQTLPWPRQKVYDYDNQLIPDDVIPTALKDAQAEAGFREAIAPNSLLPDRGAGGTITSVSAGSVSVSFDKGASVNPVFGVIDNLLNVFLNDPAGGTSTFFLQRA